jgi:hypothetical protein
LNISVVGCQEVKRLVPKRFLDHLSPTPPVVIEGVGHPFNVRIPTGGIFADLYFFHSLSDIKAQA